MIETAMLCLALNIFYEARGESLKGQQAVAQVTMNRAEWDPDKVCSVVFRPYQFSWANPLTTVSREQRRKASARFQPWNEEPQAWELAKTIAWQALGGRLPDVVGQSTHFHTHQVSPRWSRSPRKRYVTTIGGHKFYEVTRS